MANKKSIQNTSTEENAQTPGVYTITTDKLPQESKLQAITTIDGVTYYYGIPDIDNCESSENTKEYLETLIVNARQEKNAELNATCNSLLANFKSSATGVERIYDSEVEDQLNIIALVAAGVDSYLRCALPGAPKENIKHTAEQMKQIFADGLKYKSIIIGICGILKSFVESQTSIDRIRSINWMWFDTDSQTIVDPADIVNAEDADAEENPETREG